MNSLISFASTSIENTFNDIAGTLAKSSVRVYSQDAKVFATWLTEQGLAPHTLTRSDCIAYRSYLAGKYAKVTAGRMYSVARRILQELVDNKTLKENPFVGVKGFKSNKETTHIALLKSEAKEMIAGIDVSTVKGKRDYAIVSLLLRTGMRRSELAALTVGNIRMEQGHHVAVIEHGKGDKRRVAKLPVDVFRAIESWIEASGRQNVSLDAPLFTGMDKGDKPTQVGISDKLVERVVKQYGHTIGSDVTPHGLRASFITIALESGASLHQVQYAAGHEDPRTTERYQKRKINLDDNAVDYIKL